MAIDDNTSYELTGRQVKDLANKVKAKADSASLASVATSGLYSDLTGAPTIPTVYNGKLTITMNGANAGEFTANQSTDTTIALTSGPSYTAGNGINIANNEISIDNTVVAEVSDLPTNFTGATSSAAGTAGVVPAPASGDQDKVLKGDGTWGAAETDSGWQNATLTSSFTAYNVSAPAAQYRKIGSIVQIKGTLTPTNTIAGSSTGTRMFTLPDGYRPSSSLVFACQGSGIAKWTMTINADGGVNFGRYGITAFEACNNGNWLPFSATFLAD